MLAFSLERITEKQPKHMLWVLKRTVSMRVRDGSVELPKQMLKIMGKKYIQFYAEHFCELCWPNYFFRRNHKPKFVWKD